MNFEEHINNIRRSCFQHLKRISDIRKYITEDAAKQLVHAFITSRLDNGNSLLHGLPKSTIRYLKKSKIQPLNRSHALASLTVYHTSAATSALAAYRRKYNFQNVALPPYWVFALCMALLRNILQIYCIYILHHGYCDRHPGPYCLCFGLDRNLMEAVLALLLLHYCGMNCRTTSLANKH